MITRPQASDTADRGASTVSFRVSTDMVAKFAALTGDRSSLHVNEAFARRSAYRQPVVHGMLPVAFLAMDLRRRAHGMQTVPVALTARFSAPVFQGDSLTLTVDAGRSNGEGAPIEFDYRITREEAVVTTGTFAVVYQPASPSTAGPEGDRSSLLTRDIDLSNLQLEDIEVGATDVLDFASTAGTVSAFVSLLNDGAADPSPLTPNELSASVHLPNLFSFLLYSTSIGVSLPGASATFLEFSAQAEKWLQFDARYTLRGRVAHRSAATRIVKKELLVTPAGSDEVLVRGKASTLVTKPFNTMPGSDQLRSEGLDFGLAGKVVLITGASRGIGETTAKLFGLHGAKVIVNYHKGADDARRVVRDIESAGGEAIAIAGDVSNAEEVKALVRQGRERFGAIHVLVNNAARDYRPVPFLRLTWDDIQKDIDVIVKGAFLCSQEVVPAMLEQREGRIINISTVAADNPPPDQTKYVVAKNALVGLTRSLAAEFAAHNVLVNLVVPNFVETDFVAHIPDGFRKKIARDIPMQRAGSPLDVARAVVFLASRYSSFTTGQKVMVTGGGVPFL